MSPLSADYPTNEGERFLNARKRLHDARRAVRRHAADPLFLRAAEREQDAATREFERAEKALERGPSVHDLWATGWTIERIGGTP